MNVLHLSTPYTYFISFDLENANISKLGKI